MSDLKLEQEVLQIAAGFVGKKVAAELIGLETEFGGLGIDSEKFVEFLIALEQKFEFHFEDEKLHISNYKNLHDVCVYLQEKLAHDKV